MAKKKKKELKENDFVGQKLLMLPTLVQIQEFMRYEDMKAEVYNLCIKLQDAYHESVLDNDSVKYKYMTERQMTNKLDYLKQNNPDLEWLYEFNSESIQIIAKDCAKAFKRHSQDKKRWHHPKEKTPDYSRLSFPVRSDRIKINSNGMIYLPSISKKKEIGLIKANIYSDKFIGYGNSKLKTAEGRYIHFYNARVVFDGLNYYLTFSIVEDEDNNDIITANSCNNYRDNPEWQAKPTSKVIGIDIGCSGYNWIKNSGGTTVALPDVSNENYKIAKLDSELKNKQTINDAKYLKYRKKRARRRGKNTDGLTLADFPKRKETKEESEIKREINKYYKRKTNKKEDCIHKFTCNLISQKPEAVVLEDLYVEDLLIKNKETGKAYQDNNNTQTFNKNILEHCPYKVGQIIEQKCSKNGIRVIRANRGYKSSQICSCCGAENKPNKHIYVCSNCGAVMDRDDNATQNLKHYGEQVLRSERLLEVSSMIQPLVTFETKVNLVNFY